MRSITPLSEIYYTAAHDEIWEVTIKRDSVKAIRGPQAKIKYGINPEDYVPDFLGLFNWNVDKNRWNLHKKFGWLVKLGDL